ncbi:MAG TPA: tetratricopeptide repeat protein [Opitutaceae bacterium]|nr:tetratricopeptide repeat protein [Opitutaceae bacterium]
MPKPRSRSSDALPAARPPPALAADRASRRATILAGAGLALAAVAVYANSFSGPFIFDDLLSIPQNLTLGSLRTALAPPGGGLTVTGRPMLNLSFAVNRALGGDRVWGYHALNLLIHLGAGLALFGLVRRTLLLARRGAGEAAGLAFAAALLWTVHPLQTESVTYIVQRAESLMGLCYLLTLYCFLRGAETDADPDPARPGGSRAWFALSFLACFLGMGSKEVMVSAPVLVLLYDRTFLAGSFRAAWRRRGRVHLALAATWLPLAGLVLRSGNRGGTAGLGVGVGFGTYAATQFQAVAHYLWLSFWPHPLIVDYGVRWVASVGEVAPYAVLVGLLVAGTAVVLVRRPALGFCGVWFFAVLAPTSLVPGNRQTLAEHRVYLALAPVVVLAVVAAHAGLGRRGRIVLAAAAVGLGWLTVQRNAAYRSEEAIWADTVAKRPGNAYAHNNYGNILAQAGRLPEAMAQYEAALRIDPGYADALYDAGNALKRLGRLPEAIARYREALRAKPELPDVEDALGRALVDAGRPDEALAHFEQALKLDPNFTDASNDLGEALARTGRLPEAIARFEQALRANPNWAEMHNNLGDALRMAGRLPEALAQYEQAVRLKPDYMAARNNLGRALAEADRLPEAIALFEQTLQRDPAAIDARNNLGTVLLMAGRAPEAIAQFEAALRLNPNLPQVHLNLAVALHRAGRPAEAAAELEAARKLGATLPPPGG